MGRKSKKLISVIIPAYKQSRTIKKDIKNVCSVLELGLKDFDYEIIVVVDGNIDKTYIEAKKNQSRKIKIYTYEKNRGKGYAVRYGMARSKGELISFIDSGMEISPASIMMLMAHLEWYGADIIVGSKRHPVSRVNYPFLRHIMSVGYHIGVKLLFGLGLTDTQSGIKIFKRKVIKKILPRLRVRQYAMDIEILAVARELGFKRIFEAPIEVKFDKRTSRISWLVVIKMFIDTLGVFYRLKIMKYYSDNNKKNWVFDPELQFKLNFR